MTAVSTEGSTLEQNITRYSSLLLRNLLTHSVGKNDQDHIGPDTRGISSAG